MSRSEPPDSDGVAPGTEAAGAEPETLPVLQPEEYPTVRRAEHMAARHRRRRRVAIAVLSAALVVLAVGVVAIPLLGRQGQVTSAATPPQGGAAAPAAAQEAATVLLVSHGSGPERGADSITLFAVDPASDRGAILFVPTGLLVEVQGIGLERLGAAQRYGGVGLVSSTVSDLLGIDVTAAIALTDEQLGEMLAAGGPLTVEAGDQALDAGELADLWTDVGEQEQALAALPRRQQVLTAFLERIEQEPDVVADLLSSGGIDQADPAVVRRVLTELASALAADQLAFGALPVRAFGAASSDGSSLFKLSEESQTILSSLLVGADDADATRVEVRDASGNPDLAQRVEAAHRVDEVLGDDFSVVLGAVAPEEVAETEIVVHSDTAEARQRAEAVRDLLGIGTISIEEQPQTAVDVSIRLGDDFLVEAP